MTISYKEVKDKIVLCIDGCYISFPLNQLSEVEAVIADIKSGEQRYYKEDNRK